MRRGHPPPPESFASYYLRAVAFAEGCNCAELVVRRTMPRPLPARRRAGPGLWQALMSRLSARRRARRPAA